MQSDQQNIYRCNTSLRYNLKHVKSIFNNAMIFSVIFKDNAGI